MRAAPITKHSLSVQRSRHRDEVRRFTRGRAPGNAVRSNGVPRPGIIEFRSRVGNVEANLSIGLAPEQPPKPRRGPLTPPIGVPVIRGADLDFAADTELSTTSRAQWTKPHRRSRRHGELMKNIYQIGETSHFGEIPPKMYASAIQPDRYGPPEKAFRTEVVDTPVPGPGRALIHTMAGAT